MEWKASWHAEFNGELMAGDGNVLKHIQNTSRRTNLCHFLSLCMNLYIECKFMYKKCNELLEQIATWFYSGFTAAWWRVNAICSVAFLTRQTGTLSLTAHTRRSGGAGPSQILWSLCKTNSWTRLVETQLTAHWACVCVHDFVDKQTAAAQLLLLSFSLSFFLCQRHSLDNLAGT